MIRLYGSVNTEEAMTAVEIVSDFVDEGCKTARDATYFHLTTTRQELSTLSTGLLSIYYYFLGSRLVASTVTPNVLFMGCRVSEADAISHH